jgi:hypothetical protein
MPLSLLTMYGKDITGIADNLGLIRTGRETSNVIITTPRDPLLLENPRLSEPGYSRRSPRTSSGGPATLPGRMAQEAEQLMDHWRTTTRPGESEMRYPAEYSAAPVLLDALEALESHLPNIWRPEVYLHTGAGDLAHPPMTTDADLALDTSALADVPEIASTLMNAGFSPGRNPGSKLGKGEIAVDIMLVP